MPAVYPSAIKTFTTWVTGNVDIDDIVNDVQNEVVAIETEVGANCSGLGADAAQNDQVVLFQRIFS